MAARITRAVRRALRALSANNAELIYRSDEGYSIAGEAISFATAQNLAQLRLIYATHGRIGEYFASVLSPRGRALLHHPILLPEIVLNPISDRRREREGNCNG